MDIGRAISYPFAGAGWHRKLALAAVLTLIPILGWLPLLGYGMRIAQRVAEDPTSPLPEWDDWGDLFAGGLRVIAVQFVWFLPLLGLFCISMPIIVGTTVATGIDAVRSDGDGGIVTLVILIATFLIVVVLYATFVSFLTPAALGRAAAMRSLDAGLDFGLIWRAVRANAALYFVVFLAEAGVYRVMGLGALLPIIGSVVAYAYLVPVLGHLYGQSYRLAAGGEPDLAPLDDGRVVIRATDAVSGVFGGPRWRRNVLVGAALLAVPIVGWALVLGYGARIVRAVASGTGETLPGWSRWRELAVDGTRALGVIAVWGLPIWVSLGLGGNVAVDLVTGEAFDADRDRASFGLGWTDVFTAGLGLRVLLGIVGLLAQLLLPAVLGRVAIERSFGAGFNAVAAWRAIRQRPVAYAAVSAVWLGSFSFVSLGMLAFGVGVLLAGAIAVPLDAHLLGQFHRRPPAAGAVLDAAPAD